MNSLDVKPHEQHSPQPLNLIATQIVAIFQISNAVANNTHRRAIAQYHVYVLDDEQMDFRCIFLFLGPLHMKFASYFLSVYPLLLRF